MAADGRGNAARRLGDTTPGPWSAWKGTSRHGRAIRFIETFLRAPKGEGHGQPIRLHPFQKRFLEEAFAKGVEASVMPTPRGNGKSTFAAAIAAWAVFDPDETGSPVVPIVATTVGQATRSVYGVAEKMIRANSELADRALIYTGTGTSRVIVPSSGDGELFPIANGVDGLQGLDPSVAICDELGFQPVDTWDSLILAAGKRSRSLVMGMGTPGLDRDNALWHVRQLVEGGVAPRSFRFREFAAADGCEIGDRKEWRRANPAIRAGFLRIESLATALALVPPSHFRVFRLGQWVDGVESWLGDDGRAVWDACEDAAYQLEPGAPTWVGIDIGIKRDSSAVVAIQARPDGRWHAVLRSWVPTVDEPVDVTDIMGHLRDLSTRYRVGAMAFDARFFDVPAKILYDSGLPMVEVPQSVEHMTPAIGGLYTALREGSVTHGRDALFAQQVLNGVVRLNERGFTISKGKSRGRIDAAIALALALDRATHKKTRAPLVIL